MLHKDLSGKKKQQTYELISYPATKQQLELELKNFWGEVLF